MLVMLNFGIRELTVFFKYYVETQAYNTEAHNENCKQEQFMFLPVKF